MIKSILSFTIGVLIALAWAYALLLLIGIAVAALWNYTIQTPAITSYQGAALFVLSKLLLSTAHVNSGLLTAIVKLMQRNINNRAQVVDIINKSDRCCKKHKEFK